MSHALVDVSLRVNGAIHLLVLDPRVSLLDALHDRREMRDSS